MKIIINAKEHEVPGPELTYEEIARLADKPEYATCVYYTKPKGDVHREGILWKGRKVEIEEGMLFSIIVTGNA